jgi:hypothetical protein
MATRQQTIGMTISSTRIAILTLYYLRIGEVLSILAGEVPEDWALERQQLEHPYYSCRAAVLFRSWS